MSSYKEHLDLKGLDDEDDLSDDEVFTQGGKSIPLEENGAYVVSYLLFASDIIINNYSYWHSSFTHQYFYEEYFIPK
ncbi:hypothetical protein CEXT_301371 [Caerostris extrusa]|uniref:Uncharacterized protein n=1 Tax=Caerostris extrusa TaxID=172846 RepID=A0AAV4XNY0_CAEEX|nr:hypothetical protein CEXT_301371 [Caerostris extrusa]